MDKLVIDAISSATASPLLERPSAAGGVDGFSSALGKALASADADQKASQSAADKFQLNDPGVTLEDTMIAMQKANISFQMLVQVRNRLVSAYHDIMNMQV
jgi:flagellar hook-basal body complex protein FliE